MGADFESVSEKNTDPYLLKRFNTFRENNTDRIYVADLFALGFDRASLGEIKENGAPALYIDGEAQTLARYPNRNDDLLQVYTGAECIKKQCNVRTPTSCFYNQFKDQTDGWAICITEENEFWGHVSRWKTERDLWMFGALYEEWHHAFYPVSLERCEGQLTLTSQTSCPYGLKSHPHNKACFLNVPEELDEHGEWYLDRETGKLYIYRNEPLALDATVALVSARENLWSVKNAGYTVFDGLTFWGTLGHGLSVENSHDTVIQRCCMHDMRGHGSYLSNVENTAVIYCDFYHTGSAMLALRGLDRVRDMIPDRNIVQNCRFHHPVMQVAANISGILTVISHNCFCDTVLQMGTAIESFCEYNEFDRGSQDIYDSGPIYCGGFKGRGDHIRYNYLHDLNYSQYGIYLDDLSCAHYVYGNFVAYARETTGNGKCVNIHGGNQHVIYHNIFVNAKRSAIQNSPNYYVKTLYDTKGRVVPNVMRTYATGENGLHRKEDAEISYSGGLSYRWLPYHNLYFKGKREIFDEGTGYDARLPNTAIWQREYFLHYDRNKAKGDSYDCNQATMTFIPRKDTRYPWGNESLHEYLLSCPPDDLDLYLRSSAYSVYRGNICLGCERDVVQFTIWDIVTSEVAENVGLGKNDERYCLALDGEAAVLSRKESWLDVAPDFEGIPFEKIGLTE